MARLPPGSFCLLLLLLALHSFCIFALPETSADSTIIQLPSVKQIDEATDARDGGGTETDAVPKLPVCDDNNERLSCPVTCFRPDPVCGMNGVTYWCGCRDAKCANVEVAHIGFCDVRNAGSGGKGLQALLLVHTVWLILLGLSCLLGQL